MARVDLLPRLTQAVDVIQLSCFQEQLREQAIPLRPPPPLVAMVTCRPAIAAVSVG